MHGKYLTDTVLQRQSGPAVDELAAHVPILSHGHLRVAALVGIGRADNPASSSIVNAVLRNT